MLFWGSVVILISLSEVLLRLLLKFFRLRILEILSVAMMTSQQHCSDRKKIDSNKQVLVVTWFLVPDKDKNYYMIFR